MPIAGSCTQQLSLSYWAMQLVTLWFLAQNCLFAQHQYGHIRGVYPRFCWGYEDEDISEQILLEISLQTSWKLNYVTWLRHIIGECEGNILNQLKFFCLKDRLLDNCDT